jgi:hypothetical protein
MDMGKRFKWTVEIEVDEALVADGFNLTDDRMMRILQLHLPYTPARQLGAHVTSAPPDEEIASVQGYASVKEWADANGWAKANGYRR